MLMQPKNHKTRMMLVETEGIETAMNTPALNINCQIKVNIVKVVKMEGQSQPE